MKHISGSSILMPLTALFGCVGTVIFAFGCFTGVSTFGIIYGSAEARDAVFELMLQMQFTSLFVKNQGATLLEFSVLIMLLGSVFMAASGIMWAIQKIKDY